MLTNLSFNNQEHKTSSSLDLLNELQMVEKELYSFNLSEKESKQDLCCFIEFFISIEESKQEPLRSYLKSKLNLILNKGRGKAIAIFGMNSNGECIGLENSKLDETLTAFDSLCKELDISYKMNRITEGVNGKIAELGIIGDKDKFTEADRKTELRIGLFGDESTGKSTLIGVLVNGILDNGNGLAKSNIFRFQHEQNTGRTSNFSHYITGFDKSGELVNYDSIMLKINGDQHDNKSRLLWEELISNSKKIISFYDMGGQSKFSVRVN